MMTLPATQAKEKFLGLLRKAHNFGERYTITHNGKPWAILLSNEEYEGLMETLHILGNKVAAKELLESLNSADRGKTVSFEKAIGRKQKK